MYGGQTSKGADRLMGASERSRLTPSHKGGALRPLTAFQPLLSALGRTKPQVLQKA